MQKPRLITKSRFKLAYECPTKLFYTGKKEYADQKTDDKFLKALADGGYQVGELAKLYIPNGQNIDTVDHDQSLKETHDLLRAENAIIYEAATQFENFFARVDILRKNKSSIDLIEVKSKSFDPEKPFVGKKGGINSDWDPYLQDVAFQTFVFRNEHPDFTVKAYLYLTDKRAVCSVDGLNQKFYLEQDDRGRARAVVKGEVTDEDLASPIMVLKDVTDIVDRILSDKDYSARLKKWAKAYESDERIAPELSSACTKCQFHIPRDDKSLSLKCGRTECWSSVTGLSRAELQKPTVLELWEFRGKDKAIEEKKYFLADLEEDDIGPETDDEPGLSRSERQWKQVQKAKENDDTPYLDLHGLSGEVSQWLFPLHFIDFETTTVAIPFHKGTHPYEGIAFQYSHHVVSEDGSTRHAGQYLHSVRGEFPNFDFIRQLKSELDKDHGTIFRYAAHENTYLNFIISQLERSQENDRKDLIKFMQTIAKPTKARQGEWEANREMVDMLQLVRRYHYDPATHGSNSIKYVLPAVLNASKSLQAKYSQPIYGSEGGVGSLNFKNHAWIKVEKGNVINPYKTLPKLSEGEEAKAADFLYRAEQIKDGGSAMMAWARMQFTEMSDTEHAALKSALLKYCELDTFAMVMIYEYWKECLAKQVKKTEQEQKPKRA